MLSCIPILEPIAGKREWKCTDQPGSHGGISLIWIMRVDNVKGLVLSKKKNLGAVTRWRDVNESLSSSFYHVVPDWKCQDSLPDPVPHDFHVIEGDSNNPYVLIRKSYSILVTPPTSRYWVCVPSDGNTNSNKIHSLSSKSSWGQEHIR